MIHADDAFQDYKVSRENKNIVVWQHVAYKQVLSSFAAFVSIFLSKRLDVTRKKKIAEKWIKMEMRENLTKNIRSTVKARLKLYIINHTQRFL